MEKRNIDRKVFLTVEQKIQWLERLKKWNKKYIKEQEEYLLKNNKKNHSKIVKEIIAGHELGEYRLEKEIREHIVNDVKKTYEFYKENFEKGLCTDKLVKIKEWVYKTNLKDYEKWLINNKFWIKERLEHKGIKNELYNE